VQIKELDESYGRDAVGWSRQIDAGEAAAIALTLQEKADWLLSDDARARQFAESLGLEVHGSIGLLLWAVAETHVDNHEDALNLLDALAGSSLWISERVLRQARKAIDKFFSEQ
jgi:predicted nucleic acid-binding protein